MALRLNTYYTGRIKVIGCDLMCWPVHPISLEAMACSRYDPYARTAIESPSPIGPARNAGSKSMRWKSKQAHATGG